MVVCTFAVTVFPKVVPKMQSAFFWASVLGLAVIFIAILVWSPTKQPAKKVFAEWDNVAGWNDGITFMLDIDNVMRR